MARRKYNNKPTVVDGIKFDSIDESLRYLQLKSMQQAGEIEYLELQPKFPLKVNGQLICNYFADFRYYCRTRGKMIVEDVKGGKATVTAVYRLKKKLMLAIYGIKIQEVRMR